MTDPTPKLTLNQRLEKARLDLGGLLYPPRYITKEDVALAMGVSDAAVGRWEGGTRQPHRNTVVRLAALYGVRHAWLETGEEPMRDLGQKPTWGAPPEPPAIEIHDEPPGGALPAPPASRRAAGGERGDRPVELSLPSAPDDRPPPARPRRR